MTNLRNTLKYSIRIDIHESNEYNREYIKNMFISFGKIIDIGPNSVRLFTFEKYLKEISESAINNNLSFVVSPITLDDIFVNLLSSY